MPDLIAEAIQRLRRSGVHLDRGLSTREVAKIEARFGFTFGPEHRSFLRSVLPVGRSWPNWRRDPADELRGRLDWPIEGVIFDVRHNGFWPASWGNRPQETDAWEPEARKHLAEVPKLVPVFSHRYLASDPGVKPSPVFSVHQTDVIYYGDNLLDYVAHEFSVPPFNPSEPTHVPFWSDLATGVDL